MYITRFAHTEMGIFGISHFLPDLPVTTNFPFSVNFTDFGKMIKYTQGVYLYHILPIMYIYTFIAVVLLSISLFD